VSLDAPISKRGKAQLPTWQEESRKRQSTELPASSPEPLEQAQPDAEPLLLKKNDLHAGG
jgi:hypothetical protein